MALDLRAERYGSKALPKGAEATGEEIMAAAKPVQTTPVKIRTLMKY